MDSISGFKSRRKKSRTYSSQVSVKILNFISPTFKGQRKHLLGGFSPPILKIFSSKWVENLPPMFGVKIPKIFWNHPPTLVIFFPKGSQPASGFNGTDGAQSSASNVFRAWQLATSRTWCFRRITGSQGFRREAMKMWWCFQKLLDYIYRYISTVLYIHNK